MLINIPIDGGHPNHEFSIELAGEVFLLQFQFNFRDQRWSMTVKMEDSTILVAGVVMLTNWPLLDRFKDVRLPKGTFWVIDETGLNSEPSENSFGTTHFLAFETEEE